LTLLLLAAVYYIAVSLTLPSRTRLSDNWLANSSPLQNLSSAVGRGGGIQPTSDVLYVQCIALDTENILYHEEIGNEQYMCA
jgi:hypothetical protein